VRIETIHKLKLRESNRTKKLKKKMKKIRRSKKQSEETIFCTVLIKITLAL
jgi:hypothetical protein